MTEETFKKAEALAGWQHGLAVKNGEKVKCSYCKEVIEDLAAWDTKKINSLWKDWGTWCSFACKSQNWSTLPKVACPQCNQNIEDHRFGFTKNDDFRIWCSNECMKKTLDKEEKEYVKCIQCGKSIKDIHWWHPENWQILAVKDGVCCSISCRVAKIQASTPSSGCESCSG